MKLKVYIYADLLVGDIKHTNYDFWTTEQQKATGLYKSEYNTFQYLETQEVEWNGTFDFTNGKIQALELQLGDLHVKSENIKAQIQELKCIGHDTIPIRNFGDFEQFDDDISF